MKKRIYGLILVLLATFALLNAFYIVPETEQVLLVTWGGTTAPAWQPPGLHFRIPLWQKPVFFGRNVLEWNSGPDSVATADRGLLALEYFAFWRIVDPLVLYQALGSEKNARRRLAEIIRPAFSQAAGLCSQTDLITAGSGPGKVNLEKEVMDRSAPQLQTFGIKLEGVHLKRVGFREPVLPAVFERMAGQCGALAEKIRSQGQGESFKLAGGREKEVRTILSEAYRASQEIRGKGDAEAARICNQAYGRDPEFYSFLKSLEIYRTVLDTSSTLILSTHSELFKYLQGSKP